MSAKRTPDKRKHCALAAHAMLVAIALSAGPAAAQAPARVGFLSGDATCAANVGFAALREGMRSLGHREGATIVWHCRSAEGRYERLDALAKQLVERDPAVLVAAAAPASLAAKRASARLPIVSVYTVDPVALGLVASLARPGGNVTGISAFSSEYAAKSLELLKEAAPRIVRVGAMGQATNPSFAIYERELASAARRMGLAIDFAGVGAAEEIESALAALKQRGADALLVMNQPLTFDQRAHIVEAVARLGLPAMYGSREAVALGGLMSYAAGVDDTFRRAAVLVDKLLKGARPADMPVEQPRDFELALNYATAKALGLAIPESLRIRVNHPVH